MGVTEFDFTVDPKKPITNEIASAATDFDMFQGFLDQIPNPDEVLNLECGGDITVYDAIGRNPRISSALGTRARAVVGKEWRIIPYSQETFDIKVAEYVNKVLLGFPFDRPRRSFHRGGNLKGFAVGEIMWDYSEGDTFINAIHYRHQKRFDFNTDRQLLLKTITNPLGENVTIRDGLELKKFQVLTFGDEVTTPWGCGLGRELYWHWWFQKNNVRSWLQGGDKFAAPTAVGEYEPGATQVDQDKLLAAAQAIHSRSAIIHPKGMTLRLLEALRSGNISTYKELADFLNEEITICILGQTATTVGTPGKLGNEKEQGEVFAAIVKADADSECEAYNARNGGMIRWLVDYQFPGLNRYPQIWIDCEEEEDKKTLAERDEKLAIAMEKGGKYRLAKSYFVRTHGMQEDDIEEIPAAPPTPGQAPSRRETDKEKGTISFAEAEVAAPDNADLLAGRLGEEARPVMEAWLAAGLKSVDTAGNLVDLRRDILDTAMDLAPMAAVIRDGLLLGRLLGMAEVREEIAASEADVSFAEPSSIASALRLPFKEAIDFFLGKVNIPTEKWNDLFLDAHSRGFMIAGAMKGELLADLREAVDQVITQGLTIADFRKSWDRIVADHGWSYVGGRNWRTRVVYETNTRQAYNAGRWQQVTDPDVLRTRPYLGYKHGDSVHPRVLHVSWDGTVLSADDPWWDTHYPQNGWGCKCKVFSMGERDIARLGDKAKRSAPKDGTYQWTDKQGRSFEIPNGIDPGFQYNPGKAATKSRDILNERINQLPPDIAARIRTEIKEKSPSP